MPAASREADRGAPTPGARGAAHSAGDRGVSLRSSARPAATARPAGDRLSSVGGRRGRSARRRGRGRGARLPEAEPGPHHAGLVQRSHLLARFHDVAGRRDRAQPRAARVDRAGRPHADADRSPPPARVAWRAHARRGVDRAAPRSGGGALLVRRPARRAGDELEAGGRPRAPDVARGPGSRQRPGARGAPPGARSDSRAAGGRGGLQGPGQPGAGRADQRRARAGDDARPRPGRGSPSDRA